MKDNKTHNGVIIGAIFTVGSLLLMSNEILPFLSIFPGIILEIISSHLISNNSNISVGILTITLLAVTLVMVLVLFLWSIRKRAINHYPLSKLRAICIMSICNFIVHPLGLYIYWGYKLNFESDGQVIFMSDIAYSISCSAFVFIGLLIDWTYNSAIPKTIQSDVPAGS